MGQSTPKIAITSAEHLAALAVVLQRHTDRGEFVVRYCDARALAPTDPVTVSVSLADDPTFPALVGRVLEATVRPGPEAEPDAVLELKGEDEDLRLAVADRLGTPAQPEQLLQQLTTIVGSVVGAGGDQPVSTLAILDEDEQRRLLVDWNATQAPYPDRCVHDLISAQARLSPDRIAVECGGGRLTYAELDARSNQLARHLIGLGVGAEQLVGIAVERSVEMVVGLLGVLKAGGAYVPVDPTYPTERQQFMLSNSATAVVVTQQGLLRDLPVQGVQSVCLDRDWAAIATQSASPLEGVATPEQLAYVIYTSGSTGQPKGVQIPHRALINFLETMGDRPGLSDDDVLVAVTTLSFDIAGLELYLPLIKGARLVIAPAPTVSDPRALATLLSGSGATVMQATPTTWRMLLDFGWSAEAGLKALCGGEPLPTALADRLVALGIELWNMYGPTETTIWSTCARITEQGESPTIGRPIANTTIYILDAHRNLVPVGAAGELWIGGAGLARGYRNREDLTAERFVEHAFADGAPVRIYRTGDLVRYRDNGDIEFLGRIDNQVKVRGFRIELGEIETVLSRHPSVAEAVVVAIGPTGDEAEAELAAYVIGATDAPSVSGRALRDFSAESLPGYMVPTTVTTLESFPLTPNGKVDRKALPAPSRERSSATELIAARTPLERQLTAIWERELGISPIGVTDDFFDLGVTSLAAATVFAAIERELGGELPLGAIFRAPTIEALGRLLEDGGQDSRWSSLVPIQPRGTQPPIFCVHGGAGTILHLAPLARRLGPDQPFYGLQSRGLYGGEAPLATVEEMAVHYLTEMRQVHDGGPWRLAGYCFGAIVALELARLIIAAGEEVEMLVSFNGASPDWIRQWGTFSGQPGYRARHGLAPGVADSRTGRRRRIERWIRPLARLAGMITHPQRIRSAREGRARRSRLGDLLLAGEPIPEELRERFFVNLHYRAERAYAPQSYPGRLVIFSSAELYDDPSLGWATVAEAGIDAIQLPGEHTSNRDIMQEPWVGSIADQLRARLTPAHDGQPA